jgi:hypothetical protein
MPEHKRVYHDRGGVRRTLIWDDEAPHRFHTLVEQDVEPILDGVDRDREIMRNDRANKLAARIPIPVYERAVHEGWDEGDWRKWLNSYEGSHFRIWRGSL